MAVRSLSFWLDQSLFIGAWRLEALPFPSLSSNSFRITTSRESASRSECISEIHCHQIHAEILIVHSIDTANLGSNQGLSRKFQFLGSIPNRVIMAESEGAAETGLLFSFGVVADVQHADKENGDHENSVQRYREAPRKFEEAVNKFNFFKNDLLFVLTLGDIIDGNSTQEKTRADFEVVCKILNKLEVSTFNLLGNHCLSLPREEMLKKLNMPARYYQTDLKGGWKLVILDSMDMSLSWPEETQNYKEGKDFLEAHPLGEDNPQMSLWNGGIGSTQLTWLSELLKDAERDAVKLIVAAHHPLIAGSIPPTHLLWNHREVSSLLRKSPAVMLYLCGHYHPGGYELADQIHFVNVEAILEAPTESNAYGLVHVYDKEIVIDGYGTVPNRKLKLP